MPGDDVNEGLYKYVLSRIHCVIENVLDIVSYETEMQRMFGDNAAVLYGLDKILTNVFKQVHHRLLQLY